MEPSFGKGSPLLGGASPLQQVMSQGQGGLSQVSPSAPTFNPMTVPTNMGAAPLPSGNPSPSMGATEANLGLPAESSESMTIIKALSQRLKDLTKLGQ